MDTRELTRLVKLGKTNEEIYMSFLLERTDGEIPKYFYARTRKESLTGFINSFMDLGFTLISRHEEKSNKWQGASSNTIIVFDTQKQDLTLTLTWMDYLGNKNKRHQRYFKIQLTDNRYSNASLEFGGLYQNVVEKIAKIVSEWDVIQSEWDKVLSQIRKMRKQISIGNSTIDAILQNYLSLNKFPYNIYKNNGDTFLRIKLNYRRYMEFKLSPTMDMTKLTQISQMVDTVSAALKTVGGVNLTVKNFGANIQWIKPQPLSDAENCDSE